MSQDDESGRGCTHSLPGSPIGLDEPQPLHPEPDTAAEPVHGSARDLIRSHPGTSAAAVSQDESLASGTVSHTTAQQVMRSGGVHRKDKPGFPASAHVSQDESSGDLEGVMYAVPQQVVRSGSAPSKGTPGFPAAAHAQPVESRESNREVGAAAGQVMKSGGAPSKGTAGSPATSSARPDQMRVVRLDQQVLLAMQSDDW